MKTKSKTKIILWQHLQTLQKVFINSDLSVATGFFYIGDKMTEAEKYFYRRELLKRQIYCNSINTESFTRYSNDEYVNERTINTKCKEETANKGGDLTLCSKNLWK